jgi:thioesterase domain-containing protein
VSAAALLSELRRRDIQIRVVGSELRCNAPAGALTPELRDQLQQHKNDVLQLLASAQALAGQERAIVPLQRNGKRASIFAVPGHNGDVFCYRALAQSLGEDQPFFGLQPPGLDGQGEPLRRVEDIAAYFAAQIRTFQPHGPYIVAGYCAGGAVAFELAQQMLRGGAAIRFVALFGCPYPSYFLLRTQLWQGLAHQVERVGKHSRELASQSWSGRRRYLAEKLRQRKALRKALRNADQAAALDPVLMRRAKVERGTLSAVRRYTPSHFAGSVHLFLPSRQWLRSGVAALRWRALAERAEEHFAPDECKSSDMLRERNAPAFAELFRRCWEKEV